MAAMSGHRSPEDLTGRRTDRDFHEALSYQIAFSVRDTLGYSGQQAWLSMGFIILNGDRARSGGGSRAVGL